MTENNTQTELSLIFSNIFRKWKFIVGFTLIALAIGFIVYLVMDTSYKAKTTFILRNPLEADRSQVFSGSEFFQNKRYFGDQDDIDKVIAISKSNAMFGAIVSQFNLLEVFGPKAEKQVRNNLKVNRNSTTEIDVEYSDPDKTLSANIANFTRDFLKNKYEEYFKESNAQLAVNISKQVKAIDDRLLSINDSILAIRTQYGLNDQLLPVRGNTTVTQRSGNINQANGMELLSTFTNLKDKLVDEKGKMEAAIFQYESGLKEGAGFATFFVIEPAHPEVVAEVPNPKLLFPAIAVLAMIISTLIVIIKATLFRIA